MTKAQIDEAGELMANIAESMGIIAAKYRAEIPGKLDKISRDIERFKWNRQIRATRLELAGLKVSLMAGLEPGEGPAFSQN